MSQPPPTKTDTPEVWPMIAAAVRSGGYDVLDAERLAREMEARNDFGVRKYGVPVLVDNGRDPLRDALDEALDLCVYTRQQYEKTRSEIDWVLHYDAVRFASRVHGRMAEGRP